MLDRDLIDREQIYLINDSFQNRKQYNIPKAQLVLTRRIKMTTDKLKESILKAYENTKKPLEIKGFSITMNGETKAIDLWENCKYFNKKGE